MGGDSFSPPLPSTEEESSLDQDFPQNLSISSEDDDDQGLVHHNLGNNSLAVNGKCGLSSGESEDLSPRFSSIDEAAERLRLKVNAEVLRSYEELQCRLDSYNPGSWIKKASGKYSSEKSDGKNLKAQLRCNARRNCPSSHFTAINYVIFVVNGLSVLDSMDSVEGKKKNYCEMIAANFKSPLLSFKDDRPVVVVTHGDLLSLSDRVRIRTYLGELLGVPPTRQIFDIPATRLAIVDMLTYCLERADSNLPAKKREPFVGKAYYFVAFLLVLAIAIVFGIHTGRPPARPPTKVIPFSTGQPPAPPPMKGVHVAPPAKKRVPVSTGPGPGPSDPADMKIEWDKIQCMWLGDDN
ncbi:hypothetical protein PHJA_001494900 [Phtheirospermum japonicum]|uniref:Uncharacterized protein n=1 Tax=Phtheirospermum japonicum TaxID=374723 RepID=A0A830CE49_9LAMI|nr:hypothetical protein PHJA_001494900 [Phtheirospermum japonicum]